MNLPPRWSHQTKAMEVKREKFGLLFDPGCGKTRTSIDRYTISDAGKLLVIAPVNVCYNWEKQMEKFAVKGKPVFVAAGQPKAKKIKVIQNFISYQGICTLVINIETLRSEEYLKLLLPLKFRKIIIDEYHNFKTADAAQTEGLMRLLNSNNNLKYLDLLSGTPSPQGEIDLWITFFLLGKTTDSFFIWRKKHFYDVNESEKDKAYLVKLHKYLVMHKKVFVRFGQWRHELHKRCRKEPWQLQTIWHFLIANCVCRTPFVEWSKEMIDRLRNHARYEIKPESKIIFEEWLKECTMSAKKDEVLDLPEYLRTDCFVELTPEQRRVYDDMESKLYAVDDSGNEVTAKILLTRTLRLQQIAAGIIQDKLMDNNRVKALDYCIDLIGGGQFLIWTVYKPTYKQLADYLESKGITYAFITGDQSILERKKSMEEFQAGNIKALILHPKAAREGNDLTAAGFAIYYTYNFDAVNDIQSEARNYREGSQIHKRIVRINVIARDTVDENVCDSLRSKRRVQDFIMNLKRAA